MSQSQTVNRVAIVTGASRGLGRSIALRLASDGYDVALNDIVSASPGLQIVHDAILEKGRRVIVHVGDVSVEEDVRGLVAHAATDLGRVDVMVANAGICITKSIMDTTTEDWDKIFSVNGRGVFLCYKYAAIQMIKQGNGGCIIGASSIAGKRAGSDLSAYSSSKFAVRGLTQTAAQEWGKHGIRVNAYAPGPIETDMLRGIIKAKIAASETGEIERAKTSLGGHATAEDIAGIVSFLISNDARFITGQTFTVDGGTIFD